MKYKQKKGYSLIEMLVVIGIFALLGTLVAQILITSMRASRKSESINMVRGSLDYAISVMERQIRNADLIEVESLPAPPAIICKDENDELTHQFSCVLISPTDGSIMWLDETVPLIPKMGSITGQNVIIDECVFQRIIPPPDQGLPDAVSILIRGHDSLFTGSESTSVTVEAQIELRTYKY